MTPVSTIRDVAELTEASPSLIARLLDDIRGTDEFMNLVTQVKQHETRVGQVEKKVSALERSKNSSTQKTAQDAEKEFAENVVRAIAVVVVVIILFVAAINSSRKANSQGNSFLHGRQLWIDDNGNVTEQKGFEVTPVPENDPDARELRSMTAANRNKK